MVTPRGRAMIAWVVVFNVIILISYALRLASIRIQKRGFRTDDYLVTISIVSALVQTVIGLWAIANGFGARSADLTLNQISIQLRLVFSANFLWTISTTGCKLAVLYLYHELFPTRWFRKAVRVTAAITIVYSVGIMVALVPFCQPVEAFWDPIRNGTHCKPLKYHNFAAVSMNMLLDILIVALPIPVVWGLALATRRKVSITAMFSLGISIVAVMLWRLITTARPVPSTADFTYDLYVVSVQSMLEIWLGIIAANLPVSAPALSQMLPERIKSYFISAKSSAKGQNPQGHVRLRTFGGGEFADNDGCSEPSIPRHTTNKNLPGRLYYTRIEDESSTA